MKLYVPPIVVAGRPVTIGVGLPGDCEIEIALFDVRGRRLGVLARGRHASGDHSITWTAPRDRTARGLYFVHLDAGPARVTRKLVVVK